jgi:hypothetical protein
VATPPSFFSPLAIAEDDWQGLDIDSLLSGSVGSTLYRQGSTTISLLVWSLTIQTISKHQHCLGRHSAPIMDRCP